MKVLYIINSLGAGGAEKLVVDMCNHLSKREWKVSLFSLSNIADVFDSQINGKINFVKANKKGYFNILNIIQLYKEVRVNDVIHVNLFPSFYIVAILSLLFRKKKFIYTEHNTYNRRRSSLFYLIEKFMYSRYNSITCISNGVLNNLSKWIGDSDQLRLINNFVDLSKIDKSISYKKDILDLRDTDKVLVMVGSFNNQQKDQKTLIRSLLYLPENFKLIFIGDGIRKEEHVLFAHELGLSKKIVFFGQRTDVYEILKSCDYGVLSSNWEGFGIAALEYMACGIPAIGSNVDGLNEVIVSKELLFEVGDSKQIAEIILKLENHPSIRKQLIEFQEMKLKNYDINNIMSKFIDIYIS